MPINTVATSSHKAVSTFFTIVPLYNRPGYLRSYSDSLRAGRSGDRIPEGARFSATVQNVRGTTQPPIQWVSGLSRA